MLSHRFYFLCVAVAFFVPAVIAQTPRHERRDVATPPASAAVASTPFADLSLPIRTAKDERITITEGDAAILPLGVNTRGMIDVEADSAVDIFVLASDQMDSVRRAMQGESVSVTATIMHRAETAARIFWQAPDRRMYFFFIENALFPADGARPTGEVRCRLHTYTLVDTPAPPLPERGILLGRVDARIRETVRRVRRVTPTRFPVRVTIRHVDLEDTEAMPRGVKFETDDSGYFYMTQVPLRHACWIESVEGDGFRIVLTETPTHRGWGTRRSSAPGSESGPWQLPPGAVWLETGYPDTRAVLDLGTCRIVLDSGVRGGVAPSSRNVDVEVVMPLVRLVRSSREPRPLVEGRGTWRSLPDRRTPLERHDWFQRWYGNSAWGSVVAWNEEFLESQRHSSSRRRANHH